MVTRQDIKAILSQLRVCLSFKKTYPSTYVWKAWLGHIDENGKYVYDQWKTLINYIKLTRYDKK